VSPPPGAGWASTALSPSSRCWWCLGQCKQGRPYNFEGLWANKT
jgi:hypothetical protein